VVGVILMVAGLLGVVTYAGVYRRRIPGGRGGRSEETAQERGYYDGP
jgi:hypothetical protein